MLFALAALAVVGGLVLTGIKLADDALTVASAVSSLAFVPAGLAFSIVGLLVALRRPENPAGWFMLVIGAFWSVLTLPLGDVSQPQWFSNLIWVLPLGLMGTHLLLRLPDGNLPSPRWRWVSRTSTIAIVLAGVALPSDGSTASDLQNVAGLLGLVLLLVSIIASVASLFVRARRADADERHQLRWIALGGLTFIGFYALAVVPGLLGIEHSKTADDIVNTLGAIAYSAVPIGIGIAILKYRLYDIDVVIRKTLVFGALAAFVTVVYVARRRWRGGARGLDGRPRRCRSSPRRSSRSDSNRRWRAPRRFADRLVYGKRATPYEVLAEFGERLGETYAADDVLPRMARVLGEGAAPIAPTCGCGSGTSFGRSPRGRRRRPRHVDGGAADRPIDASRSATRASCSARSRSRCRPTTRWIRRRSELVDDLAAQAGLVLRNVRLIEELRARIDDLQAAQKRLVAAQDEERRRLERNIHDGAQQQLVALTVKLRLADALVRTRSRESAARCSASCRPDTNDALEDLRDLARGIYPPLLADKGLLAALEAQARKASAPGRRSRPDGIGRYPQEIEAAVVLLVPRGAAERGEVRAGIACGRHALGRRRPAARSRSPTTGVGFDPVRRRLRHRAPGHRRPAGSAGRNVDRHQFGGQRHDRGRYHPGSRPALGSRAPVRTYGAASPWVRTGSSSTMMTVIPGSTQASRPHSKGL